MHELTTPRLDLRPIGEGDASLYCRLYTDPEVMRHVAPPLSQAAAQRAFDAALALSRHPAPSLRLWVLSERDPGRDVGILALIRHRDRDDALELGTMLLAAAQGRGLAAEAQVALLDRHFSIPDNRVVWSRNAVGNRAAAAVRRKLGFEPDTACESGPGQMRWQMPRERWLTLRAATAVAREAEVG